MKLEFHREADLELLEAPFDYDVELPGLGQRFGTDVKRVTDLLLEYPTIDREVGSGRPKFSLHRIPRYPDLRGIARSSGCAGGCA